MPYDLDTVDRRIISILQQDGRTSNVEIARRVGISEATVRKRLERLISEHVIQVTAVPDANKVGLPTVTFITLDVDLAQLDRIADELARLPQVRAIYYTSGDTDLILEAWFPSGDELLHFLTRRLAAISGINKAATSHVLRTIKDGSSWILPPASPPRVLVVDDDPDFVEVMRLTLAAEGIEVMSANNGEQALSLMRMSKPDLLILDIMMQGVLDGLRTAKELRSDGDLRAVPILLVSSTGTEFARLLPPEDDIPVDNFLVKPVEPALLLAEVRRLLRTHQGAA
jgi:Lrp/AsnC family transcriptional regulator for asnA, asnC and gidA